MPTNNYYFIQITPLGNFFFGGEETFNTEEIDNNGKDRVNYFARSRELPQQTALLGMLRHALLMHNKTGSLLNADSTEKASKVGRESFSKGYDENYGIIQYLSPIFLCTVKDGKPNSHWLPAGYDHQQWSKKNEPGKVVNQKVEIAMEYETHAKGNSYFETAETINSPLTLLQSFDHKQDLLDRWKNYNESTTHGSVTKTLALDDIFQQLTKVGVNKKKNLSSNLEENDSSDAFYKQTLMSFKNHGISHPEKILHFGCYLEVSGDLNIHEKFFMPFGADQSEFIIHIQPLKPADYLKQDTIFENKNGPIHKITALSDCLIQRTIFNHCRFAIAQKNPFRHIISKVDAADYYKSSKVTKVRVKEYLLKRGSVLYTDKAEEVLNQLLGNTSDTEFNKNVKSFRRIGYNYFQISKIKDHD